MTEDGAAAPRGGAWQDRAFPAVIASLGLLFIVLSIEPFPVGVFQDDGIYTVLAKSLATGHGYRFLQMPGAPHAAHYPPLYPLLLAGLWKLSPGFPGNVTLFKFANAALVAVAAIFGYRFARKRVGLGPVTSFLSVGAFTVCAPIILLGVMVLSEPLFLAALCPVLLASERAAASGRPRDAVVAGAAGAGLALVRTLGVVTIPATVLVLAWRRRWRAAGLVIAAGALVLLPWELWVAAHASEIPAVFQGKYGSYVGWVGEAMRHEGPRWVARLIVFNLAQLVAQGWASLAVDPLPATLRWASTIAVSALFLGGWWRLTRRAPVAAWMVALYLALVVSWPFMPARFTWAIWPLVGMVFGLAIDAVVRWRPAGRGLVTMRWSAIGVSVLLAIGYVRYNVLGASRGWWTQVQAIVADRAKPLAEWLIANTPEDAVIATDDDALIYLYTGRHTVPNGTFTPQEHLRRQTPAFATATLRTIIRTYRVDYVLASSDYGTYAASGLVQARPPELSIVRALRVGAVFKPLRPEAVAP